MSDEQPPVEAPIEGEIVNQPPKSRLTKHDENIVLLLETAFHNGFNITEACQHADISRTTFYEWLADDDVFSYRMSVAQSALNRKAKTNVFEAINAGDPAVSLRYLTLRDPDYKPRTILEAPEGQQRTEEKLKEFLDDTNDGAYPNTTDDGSAEPVAGDSTDSRGEVAQSPSDIS